MSGTVPSYPFPTTLGTQPKEGAKYVGFRLNLTLQTQPLLVNLLSQFQSGRFTTAQAVLVDNSTNGVAVGITALESGQTVIVPAFTAGCYPMIVASAPEFSVTTYGSSLVSGTVGIFFLNQPGPLFESNYVPPAEHYTNDLTLSVNTPLLLPLGTSGGTGANSVSISSIDLTLSPNVAPGAAGSGFLQLYEQATGGLPNTGAHYRALWSTQWSAAANTLPYYQRQVSFPAPILQSFAGNPIWLVSIGATVATATASLTMTYRRYTIA